MRRSIFIALAVAAVAVGIWAGGAYLGGGPGVYRVSEEPDGAATFSLVVEKPGLFVDLVVPLGPNAPTATIAGKEATLFAPWPGQRLRLLTFWRGPAAIRLFEGPGPFYVEGQTRTVKGTPEVAFPQGWRYEGEYVGRLEPLAGTPVPVFIAAGVGSDMAAKVTKLYQAAATLFQSEPQTKGPVVIPGPYPENAAIAVLKLWFPEYDDEARWWYAGALKFYAVRLLDQTGLWNGTEKSRYQKAQSTDPNYMMVLWLDATIRLDKSAKRSLDDVARPALAVHTNKELLKVIEEKAGLAVSDKIYRMLKGREPKPLTAS